MAKRTWRDMFAASLAAFAEKHLGGPEFFTLDHRTTPEHFLNTEAQDGVSMPATNALGAFYMAKAVQHLEAMEAASESPIEFAMGCALAVAAHVYAENVWFKVPGGPIGDREEMTCHICIEPQARISRASATGACLQRTSSVIRLWPSLDRPVDPSMQNGSGYTKPGNLLWDPTSRLLQNC